MRSLEKPPSASRNRRVSRLRTLFSSLRLRLILLVLLAVILAFGLALYTNLNQRLIASAHNQLPLWSKFAEDNWGKALDKAGLGLVAMMAIAVGWVSRDLLLRHRLKVLLKARQRMAGGDLSDRETHLLEITAERCTMAILNAQIGEQTKQVQERLQLQFDRMPMGCILHDSEFRVQDWNPAAEKIFGFTKEEALGKHLAHLVIPPASQPDAEEMFRQLATGDMTASSINENVTDAIASDGRTIWCEWYNTPLQQADGKVMQYMAIVQDISDRHRAEEQLRESERRYHTLAKVSPVGIFRTNAEGGVIYVNERWCEISGLTLEESLGEGWVQALHPDDRERVFLQWFLATKEDLPFQSEYRLQGSHGVLSWVFSQAIAEKGPGGELLGYVGTIADISKRKQAEEQLRQDAFYDRLTGLPHRAYLLKRLGEFLERTKRDKVGLFAVLFLDLDHLQIVKYSLGHLVADELIQATATRLKECLGATDIAARVGSDEFAILLADLPKVDDATSIADQIYQKLSSPFNLDGREVFLTASIGIALGAYGGNPVEGYDLPEHFLRAADTAMHHAKMLGKLPYAVFEPAMHTRAVARLQLDTDLRWAIQRQELQVYYQPIVSLLSSQITGFEALVRWQHPQRGFLSPAEFISVAEETGLIIPIGEWVLMEACRQLRVWQQRFPTDPALTMSVNISRVQFRQPGLIEQIDRVLQETGLEPSTLKLEITESVVMDNAESATTLLEQLKTRNIQLAMDDFGTGYSSLSYLHRFPVDTLKIDRSFVSRMGVEGENLEIVRTIATLAHHLGMDVIAEGVETAEQLAQLGGLQCEYGQGYFFSCPVDSSSAAKLLATLLCGG